MLAVVEWAREQVVAGGSFEVFVEHSEHAIRGGSEVVPVTRHIRVYGAPADGGGVTEEVTFTASTASPPAE